MKCDELKPIDLECNMGKDINGVEHREPWKAYDIEEVDAAIAELKQKIEDAKATAYTDSVDAGMENRRLKRALLIARAKFCARSCEFFSGIMSHCLIGQRDLYERCEKRKNKYLNATYKCRAKAEEYK